MNRSLESLPPLPGLPQDRDGPVFSAPWQAQAFALAMVLRDRGIFTWSEWAERLGREIKIAQIAGDRDEGDTYYRHWLATLEGLVVEKGTLASDELMARRAAWDRAARSTPHGQPIELGAENHHHD